MKPRLSQAANIGLLFGGYGFGQGAVFLTQTWLIAAGEYRLLASFGTHFLFAVLGSLAVDAGSNTTLARHAASASGSAAKELSQAFWNASVFRMLLAMALIVAASIYAFAFAPDGFSRNYVLFAAPGLLFVACNAAGLLDGFKFSGISGTSAAFPYAVSALVLIATRHASPDTAGAALGAAFAGGSLLMVVVQWIALVKLGWRPHAPTTTMRGLRRAAREGGAMLWVLLPPQIYGRAQVVLSATYFGAETTALFLYAKQVATGALQIVAFVQRVEFPTLVACLSGHNENPVGTALRVQKLVAATGISFTAAVSAAGLIAAQFPGSKFSAVAPLLSAFAPTILTVTAVVMMMQGLAATGAYEGLAVDITVFHLVGVVASYVFLSRLGVYAFIAADILSTLLGVVLLALRLGRSKQQVAAMGQQP
ncbi:hypothetical protein [Bradyrhizobium commune]|uniref:Uncharacterized protein n=1 Tax=Bradyrhizobium commune TaxID=83627 RepID=A0A7S9H213_9BRAD|nr:hypothetical protein [Bradyrhizobium commune]QPF94560.1 hypothetical protein IC761_15355 [Bradyrhizobium commune]